MEETGEGTTFASPPPRAPDAKTKRNALMRGVVVLAAEESKGAPLLGSDFARGIGV